MGIITTRNNNITVLILTNCAITGMAIDMTATLEVNSVKSDKAKHNEVMRSQ